MKTCLHTRSAYTLLDSTLSIEQIVDLAKQKGYEAIALCDVGVLYGVSTFLDACRKHGLHGIIGLECTLSVHEHSYGLLLYAKDYQGYQGLIHLSQLHVNKQPITFESLAPFQQHLVVTNAAAASSWEDVLLEGNQEVLTQLITQFAQQFDHYYVGLLMNDNALYQLKNRLVKRIADELGVACVAVPVAYYANVQGVDAYKVMCGIKQGKTRNDPALLFNSNAAFKSYEELHQWYDPAVLANNALVAAACNVDVLAHKTSLPVFENKYQLDSKTYLRQLAQVGLKKRLKDRSAIPTAYQERLEYELDIIISRNFEDYFLIVYDFIRFAKQRGIYVGPGRGSAAGSLVSYVLGITGVDPLQYQLVFERFLNPERIAMPDIDIDFPDNRRDEVIQYVRERYGIKRVANIATFGTLGAKQVMRDVSKVLSIPAKEVDLLAKSIPSTLNMTLQRAYQESSRFQALIDGNPKYQEVLKVAMQLEGLPRHVSTHAAGVVLSQQPIEDVIPVQSMGEAGIMTQYQMDQLERYGLIKIDFLGLRNLTIIDEVVHEVQKQQAFDILKIDLNDAATLAMIGKANTQGVFQLESAGMRSLLMRMQPRSFEEVAAVIALFRPGPMQFIDQYLANRANPEQIAYLHPDLKPLLENTYGIMVYQEQIIAVAQKLAGFSAGKAEVLRKAISKKLGDQFIALRNDFVSGAVANGYSQALSEEVFSWMERFANYGFNRSHSIAYGMIAMQMAYLKTHVPHHFYAAILNSVIGNATKIAEYLFEAKAQGIVIHEPSIQHSDFQFTMVNGMLYYPLSGIKGMRASIISAILEERALAPFEDYFKTIARLHLRKVSKSFLESLIQAGALDFLYESRASMLATLEEALRYAEIVKIEDESQVYMDFNLVTRPKMIEAKENKAIKAQLQHAMLGVYLQDHPMVALRKRIDPALKPLLVQKQQEARIVGLGQVRKVRPHRTKKGDAMAFVSVEDETMTLDLVLMPKTYEKYKELLQVNALLYFEAKNDQEQSCIVWSMKPIHLDK